MAKKFMGFKPETMTNKILPALGYNGPKDQKSINAFLAANPAAAAKMGKYTMAARQMVEGKPIQANTGYGPASKRPLHTIPKEDRGRVALERLGKDIFGRSSSGGGGGGSNRNITQDLTRGIRAATNTTAPTNPTAPSTSPTPTINPDPAFTPATRNPANMMPSGSLLSQQIGNDPNAMVTRAGVVAKDGGPATLIPQGTGQAGPAAQAAVKG